MINSDDSVQIRIPLGWSIASILKKNSSTNSPQITPHDMPAAE